MALNRRMEILFSEEEFEAIKRQAKEQGISTGEYVRDAVRRIRLQPSTERRREAIAFLTSGPAVDVGDWEEAKKLIGRFADKEPDV